MNKTQLPPQHLPESASKRSAPAGTTILLVDDEENMRTFLHLSLRGEGYRLIVARNGEEALSLSEGFEGEIHLLITDVMMPVMNGKELADRLCILRPSIKVLFISGFGRADLWPLEACEDQTDWLPKPFTSQAFIAKVRQFLNPPARS